MGYATSLHEWNKRTLTLQEINKKIQEIDRSMKAYDARLLRQTEIAKKLLAQLHAGKKKVLPQVSQNLNKFAEQTPTSKFKWVANPQLAAQTKAPIVHKDRESNSKQKKAASNPSFEIATKEI